MAQQLGAGFGLGGGAQAGLDVLLRRDFEKREIARREAAEQERSRSNRAQEGFLGQRLGLEERGLGLEERGLNLREQDLQSQLSMRDIEKALKTLEAQGIISDQEFTDLNRTLFKEGLEGPFGSMLGLAGAMRSTGAGVQAPNLADPTGEVAHGRDKELIAAQGKEARLTRATPTINLSGGGSGGRGGGVQMGGLENMSPAQKGGASFVMSTLSVGMDAFDDLVESGAAGSGISGKLKAIALEGQRRLGVDSPAVDAAQRLQVFIASAPALVKMAGDSGNIAQPEQQRMIDALVPRVTDPLNIQRAKLRSMGELIQRIYRGTTPEEFSMLLDRAIAPFGTPEGAFVVDESEWIRDPSALTGGEGETAQPAFQIRSIRKP